MLTTAARTLHPVAIRAITDLAPQMRRFRIAGDGLRELDTPLPGGWMKVFVPVPGQAKAHGRAYTIRRFDPSDGTMDLDFVLHGDSGRASAWAGKAEVGDSLDVAGPREGYAVDPAARAHVLVGDSTTLPAIATIIEALDAEVEVHAFLELTDAAEASLLPAHPGLRLGLYLSADRVSGTTGRLEKAIRDAALPDGIQVFVAGEAVMVRSILFHLTSERGLPRSYIDASGYWRVGIEDHRDRDL